MKPKLGRLEEVNKELWLLLSLFAICLVLNLVVDAQRMVLSFYTIPTLGSAYLYGRRHATLTALALILTAVFSRARREGWAFAATGVAAIGFVATIFTGLYPRVLVSDPVFANSLTIDNASSADYSLTVMTIVAAVLIPVILLYQAWTYHVFRARLGGEEVGSPVDLVAHKPSGS